MGDKNMLGTLCKKFCQLAVLAALLLGSVTAHAEDFKTHYDLALALYQAQRFEDAIPEFKAAYQLAAKPALLFNLAQAYRKAGHPREAVEYYDRYLSATPQLDDDTRHKVDSYLTEARNTLAALELEMKRRLAEDKAAHEHEHEPEPLPPAVTTSVPTGQLVGTGQLTAPAPAGTPAAAAFPARAEPSPPSRPLYRRWWFWTILGGAVTAGVVIGVAAGTHHPAEPLAVPSGVPRGTITF